MTRLRKTASSQPLDAIAVLLYDENEEINPNEIAQFVKSLKDIVAKQKIAIEDLKIDFKKIKM